MLNNDSSPLWEMAGGEVQAQTFHPQREPIPFVAEIVEAVARAEGSPYSRALRVSCYSSHQ